MSPSPEITLHDDRPSTDAFHEEVLAGLLASDKELPSKYLYDERGSQLFEQICALDEYYLTRTELAIMEDFAEEMAERLGPKCLLIELGSGSSTKTRILLDHLNEPAAYIPVDISCEHLEISARALTERYPELDILPVCADFTLPFTVPKPSVPPEKIVIYFPGSTIGNFTHAEATRLLGQLAGLCAPGDGLLIGVDLKKDVAILESAYNDSEGVTSDFTLNLLRHINRELGTDFLLENFRHDAFFDEEEERIEIRLVSLRSQTVNVGGVAIEFDEGEPIRTEYSHKYSLAGFEKLARSAGLAIEHVWSDADNLFSVQYLTVE